MHIIDRRRDPHGKSLANRQRFIRRARSLLRRAVREASRSRSISDTGGGEITVPADGMHEPVLRRGGERGVRNYVLPGNKKYVEGDAIERPPRGGGGGGASADGDGEDEFRFALSNEEFMDLFLEDLELPNMAKRQVMGEEKQQPRRAGYRSSGPPSALSVPRTMRNSLSRRIALRRPSKAEIEVLRARLRTLEDEGADTDALQAVRAELERLQRRARLIPFIDPLDVRYRRYEAQPRPVAQAVMFCLMDVSGSMDEHMKDLAKRFFSLLYLFLSRRYRRVEVVFIRHTHEAKEVDEETFFHSRETGGTVVSTALEEMLRVQEDRFPSSQWNIYAAQASDGDNLPADNSRTVALLKSVVLPLCQYYAYLEVGRTAEDKIGSRVATASSLWRAYDLLISPKLPFAMRKVSDRRDIYPVFRELFEKKKRLLPREGAMTMAEGPLLYKGADWDFATLSRIHDAIERIAHDELGLDIYRNRIEIITSEQMLDAYASTGMPLFYKHWSFGKQFVRNEALYRKGWQGLAYEIVINSNPCVVYVMEENSATMQAIVLAHAAFGHNHFFKNNYVFKQWTDADGILDYLDFAKSYIAKCEESHGAAEVERLLDAAHALMGQGVHRYPGKRSLDLRAEQLREQQRREHGERLFNDLWRTVPEKRKRTRKKNDNERRRALLGLPEENVLYFLEKTAPRLKPWQREVIRIVRLIAQYFYPQRQTKVMNEGCATFVHYHILTRLHETGQIDDGAFLEFLHSHTNVVMQPKYDDRRYGGINPYALGFAMMQDIERMCVSPTPEDRHWFPDIAGCGEPARVLREVWADYRDESFISQFLSPQVIRTLGLFLVVDDERQEDLLVDAIHNERGYIKVRRALARLYDVSRHDPDLQIVDVDLDGDRRLELRHHVHDGVTLDEDDAERVLQHLANLWGYDVHLVELDDNEHVFSEHRAEPSQPFT